MKITTLVPAYKPKYLIELLTSLRHQTVKPARIIFSDDSPDQAFVSALTSEPLKSVLADLNVLVVPGPRSGAYNNFRSLLDVWSGETELFHFLLDDDIIYPAFYERHLIAHTSAKISCSISRRWTAMESGLPLRDLPVPAVVDTHGNRLLSLDAKVLFSTTAAVSTNWLGEFSNAVFVADLADMVRDPRMDSISYAGLEDLGSFLNASLRAPIGYINDHLGYFRTSTQQHSANIMGTPWKMAHLAYITLAIAGRRLGQVSAEQAATCLASLGPIIGSRYANEPDMGDICALMPALASGSMSAEEQFLSLWHIYSGDAAYQISSALPVTLAS
jgi:hypothetical protein